MEDATMTDNPKASITATFTDMPLTSVLKRWMDEMEWSDEIEVDEERRSARCSTQYSIVNQSHRLFLETDENKEWFSVFLYGPVNVPILRRSEVAEILNIINLCLGLGRLVFLLGDEPGPIQFLARVDVEGSELAPTQITNLLKAGLGTFETYGDLLAKVALTKLSVDELWSNFMEEEATKEAGEQQQG
jgi:hypothetical protein